MVRLRRRRDGVGQGASPRGAPTRRADAPHRDSALRRPEHVLPFPHGRRSEGGRGDRSTKWRPLDVVLLVYAALRIMLPFALAILAAATAAYGLFMLAFG